MSSAQRLMLLAGTLVVLVGGFILLSPGGKDDNGTASVTTPIATTGAPPTTPTTAENTIVVKGGEPVGGIKTIKATKDDRVTIVVSSPDTTSEVHFHGYDIKRDLKAGGKVTFAFDAKLEGVFEMELEGTSTQIAKIVISPS